MSVYTQGASVPQVCALPAPILPDQQEAHCAYVPLPLPAPIPLLGLSLGDEGSHPTPACPHPSPQALTPGDAQNPHDADDGGVDGQRRIDLDLLQSDAHDRQQHDGQVQLVPPAQAAGVGGAGVGGRGRGAPV